MLLKDLLAAVEEIERDLAYTQDLQAKWEKEAERFPVIFEYIKKQSEFFRQEIEKLLSISVGDNAMSDFVRQRARAARVSVAECAVGEAQAETAQKKPEEKESAEIIQPPIAQEPKVCEPQLPAASVPVGPSAPPAEEKEKVSTRKRSKKPSDKKSISRTKSRKRARKAKGRG
jgi:hypothetical protein